jgi:hypothetical protein
MRSFSSLVTPGRVPPSTSARRTHRRSVSAVIPNLLAIEPIAAHSEGCSPRCSLTIRTARSRNSCGYLFGLVIAPSSQGVEPPGNPGRFSRILSAFSAADAHHGWSLPGGSSPLGAARRHRRATDGEGVRHPAVRSPTIGKQRESKQFRPRRQDAPAQGRPAPDAPEVAPVANSPTEVLSVLAGSRCRSRSSARTARACTSSSGALSRASRAARPPSLTRAAAPYPLLSCCLLPCWPVARAVPARAVARGTLRPKGRNNPLLPSPPPSGTVAWSPWPGPPQTRASSLPAPRWE